MADSNTFVFISISLLLISEISSRTTEVDLESVTDGERYLLFVPNLGRFSLLHSVNVSILFLLFYVLLTEYLRTSSTVELLLLFFLGVIYTALPILETNHYEGEFIDGTIPLSVKYQGLFAVTSFVALPLSFVIILTFSQGVVARVVSVTLFSLVLLFGTFLFLDVLYCEVSEIDYREKLNRYHFLLYWVGLPLASIPILIVLTAILTAWLGTVNIL
ncbi:hypothetical protein [Haloarchaeobius sp. TZWSO28]|uniref:hypothetical protein n=1 Tax=Haloarchaeobius sp. TZWSO28 TaxID=3446119 RepID=UPI003EB7EDFA